MAEILSAEAWLLKYPWFTLFVSEEDAEEDPK